ncbi:hypothetical protein ACTHQF_00310 [Pedobacter sp. SAFR-022]|uniref:hypothetical protein n=1 Tax=Pedobacter sp. SAFR-022 TaxID=3436861 RepID=UPI003F7FD8FD
MKSKFNLSLIAAMMAGTALMSSCSKSDDPTVDPIVDPVTPPTGSDASLADSFFDKVAYKGAFGTTDWTKDWTNFDPKTTVYPATTETLEGTISANKTLDASKVYLLKGFVYVTDGVTLTIPAGTIIRGDEGSKASLVVTRGGKIMAEGTASKPIVFTSNKAVGSRAPGDWGGIIILGKAKNNIPGGEGLIEGGFTEPFGKHGGSNDEDNSGVLKYVRVEFPGIPFVPGNEINGITFGSVGRGTTLDYLQVSYCGDDSYEWFGGTVNAKHLVSIANIDDVFDFDNGYTGKLQYLVAQRDPALADQAGQSNGIESDNSEKAFTTEPRTRPVISNLTLVGPGTLSDGKHENANLWRRGSKMVLANSIFINARYGIDIRDKETGDALTDGSSLIKNNIYQANEAGKEVMASGATPSFANVDLLKTYLTSKDNVFIEKAFADALLTTPYSLTAPNFTVKAGSAAASGASF